MHRAGGKPFRFLLVLSRSLSRPSTVRLWQVARVGYRRSGLRTKHHLFVAGTQVMKGRFRSEESTWSDRAKNEAWLKALEQTGPENVKARLAQHAGGSASAISIGTQDMTKGFAQEWLKWRDERKANSEALFRIWARLVASLGVVIALAVAGRQFGWW